MMNDEKKLAIVQFALVGRVGGDFPPCLDELGNLSRPKGLLNWWELVSTLAPALQVQVYAPILIGSTTARRLDHLAIKVSGG